MAYLDSNAMKLEMQRRKMLHEEIATLAKKALPTSANASIVLHTLAGSLLSGQDYSLAMLVRAWTEEAIKELDASHN